ncbi:MAG: hypothetical protein P8174_07485, partial [Gemmatimonadota bacterium]
MNSDRRDVANEKISKTQRWLDLIAFLVKHHFPVSFDQVMEGVPAYARKYHDDARPAPGEVHLDRALAADAVDALERAAGLPGFALAADARSAL